MNPISSFGILLEECGEKQEFSPVLNQMKLMGPSAIDAELRSLAADICGSNELMIFFLEAIKQGMETNRDFELMHSYLGLFLKVYTDAILSDAKLVEKCAELKPLLNSSWNKLELDFNRSLCIINYLRSAIL